MTKSLPVGTISALLLLTLLVVHERTAPAPSSQLTAGVRPAAATVPAACLSSARRGFWPTRAKVRRAAKRIPVFPVGRTRSGVPLTPPLTDLGKRSFGWDKRGPKPGARRGNVRFNAHTYPNGSALGNRLLARLWVGGVIVVRGANGKALCYRVARRKTVRPTSKTALVGLTKALSRELGGRAITVNLVNPGPTDTELNPADIAATVAFLAGPGGRYLTGSSVNVDGGFTS